MAKDKKECGKNQHRMPSGRCMEGKTHGAGNQHKDMNTTASRNSITVDRKKLKSKK